MSKKLPKILDKLLLYTVALLVLLFILYPFICVFWESISTENGFNFDSFQWLKTDAYLVGNSLKVAILTTLISTFFSIVLSIFHFLQPKASQRILLAILMVTMISPPTVTSLSFIQLFGRRGLISHGLLGLSLNPYGMVGIVLMESLAFTPLNAILMIGFLSRLDRTVLDSARSLGATTTELITDMILPLMKASIKVVLLLTFIRSLADFSTPRIIGGPFKVLATEAYLNIIGYGQVKKATALSIVIFLPALVVFLLYAKEFKAMGTPSGTTTSSPVSIPGKGPLYRLIQVLALGFLSWILLQYGGVFLAAITDKAQGKLYFTLDHIRESKTYLSSTFTRSIVYSIIAGVVGSVLGLILEYYTYIRGVPWMKGIDFIATMPYIVPGTFFGLGYIFAFNGPPLELTGTALIVILNVIFKQLPFATKISHSTLTQISRDTIDAAKDLGGGDLYVLKDVLFPLSKSGLYIAFVNSFTATMTTIGSVIFLVRPNQKLATLVMFDAISSGKYGVGAVIACLLILICMAVNLLYYGLLSGERRKAHVS